MKIKLEDIYQAGLKLLIPLHLRQIYKIIINEAIRISKADYGTLYLSKKGKLVLVYTTIPIDKRVHLRKKGFNRLAFTHHRSFIVLSREMHKVHPEFPKEIKSTIIFPLFYNKQSIGTVTLRFKDENKTKNINIKSLELFGQIVSLAIRKSISLEQTKEALHNRDLFISIASHELKTPLTVIKAYAQLVNATLKKGATPKSDWIEQLLISSNRLTKLLNELLQIEQIRKKQLLYKRSPISLTSIVKSSIENSQLNFPTHKYIFKNQVSKNDIVYVDEDKISEAFINLLNNAAKFSPQKSIIKIDLEKNRSHLLLTIADQGQGIPKDQLRRIFDPFYKGSKHVEGMGLGLFLVNEIIKKHKGTIQYKSEVNKGTNVLVKLPCHVC